MPRNKKKSQVKKAAEIATEVVAIERARKPRRRKNPQRATEPKNNHRAYERFREQA